MKVRDITKSHINADTLRNVSAKYRTIDEIAKALGLKKNTLRYLLHTDYIDDDGFIEKIRHAYYEGHAEYWKNYKV